MLCPVHLRGAPGAAWAGLVAGFAQKGVTWSEEKRGNGCVSNTSLFVEQRYQCVRL